VSLVSSCLSLLVFICTDSTSLFFLNSQNIWRRSVFKARKHIQTARRWIRLSRSRSLTRGWKPVEKRKLSIWQDYKYLHFTSETKHPLSFIIKCTLLAKIAINLHTAIDRMVRGLGNFVNVFAFYYTLNKWAVCCRCSGISSNFYGLLISEASILRCNVHLARRQPWQTLPLLTKYGCVHFFATPTTYGLKIYSIVNSYWTSVRLDF